MAATSTSTRKRSSGSKVGSRKKGASKKVTDTAQAQAAISSLRKGGEITGLLLLGLAIALFLSLFSFNPADLETTEQVSNWIGPVGAYTADIFLYIFGIGAFFFVAVLFLLGGFMLVGYRPALKPSEFVGQGLLVFSGAILCHLIFRGQPLLGHPAGGLVGELLGGLFTGLNNLIGTYIFSICVVLLALMLLTDKSLGNMVRWAQLQCRKGVGESVVRYQTHRAYQRQLREEGWEEDLGELPPLYEEEEIEARVQQKLASKKRRGKEEPREQEKDRAAKTPKRSSRAKKAPEEEIVQEKPKRRAHIQRKQEPVDEDRFFAQGEEMDAGEEPAARKPKRGILARLGLRRKSSWEDIAEEEPVETSDDFVLGDTLGGLEKTPQEPSFSFELGEEESAVQSKAPAATAPGRETKASGDKPALSKKGAPVERVDAKPGDAGPQIVESPEQRLAREKRKQLEQGKTPVQLKKPSPGEFELPPLDFLNFVDPGESQVDKERLRSMADRLVETLQNFGIKGEVVAICPGPVITMFEFLPAPGVKLSKIANLSDDLAMALAALSVRIIAPIPGKGVVGIEVPNPTREMVFLKEIIADERFQVSKARMPMALGKNTEGGPVVADLASMPHLLVAGATGSGKSVAVNTMIVSLLYRFTPEDVRLIMVDPKMLEFSIYEGIPHLLLPVVTDPKKAAQSLNWAVDEMERRYHLLATMGVRNIVTYNQRVEKLTKQCEADLAEGKQLTEALQKMQIDENGTPKHQRLPYIVCIIDEFADLMMVASKDVETCVARLAHKARAAGIHLILATQRPSVDVITGLIKANFPTRIALRVAQRTDSRTILDSNGAENLLGKGDMLFLPPGSSQQMRCHGAFVSEDEIEKLVHFLKEQGAPEYDESILEASSETNAEDKTKNEDYDECYDDAVRIVTTERKASISMIQRKLRVGYNRAARMIETMEAEGIVGPSDGSKPRPVLAPPPPDF